MANTLVTSSWVCLQVARAFSREYALHRPAHPPRLIDGEQPETVRISAAVARADFDVEDTTYLYAAGSVLAEEAHARGLTRFVLPELLGAHWVRLRSDDYGLAVGCSYEFEDLEMVFRFEMLGAPPAPEDEPRMPAHHVV